MDHHKKEISMNLLTYNFCFLITNGNDLRLVGKQTDNTLILGEIRFSEKEEIRLKFDAKPKKRLSVDNPLSFSIISTASKRR